MKNKRQMKNLTLAKYYKMKWERRSVLVNNTFGLKYKSKGLREWYYLNLKKIIRLVLPQFCWMAFQQHKIEHIEFFF